MSGLGCRLILILHPGAMSIGSALHSRRVCSRNILFVKKSCQFQLRAGLVWSGRGQKKITPRTDNSWIFRRVWTGVVVSTSIR